MSAGSGRFPWHTLFGVMGGADLAASVVEYQRGRFFWAVVALCVGLVVSWQSAREEMGR